MQDCWKCHWCWLGRCHKLNDNYGKDISVKSSQPSNCKDFISEENWRNQYHPMTLERTKELLNAFINHLSVAENNSTVIQELLSIGFTKDELINEFNFCEDDVKDIIENMKDEED